MQTEDYQSTNEVTQTQQSQQTFFSTLPSIPVVPQKNIQYQNAPNLFKNQTKNIGNKIYSTQFLTEDMFLAIGCDDGAVRIMSTSKGDVQYVLRNIDHSPVSCLSMNKDSSKIKNSVMATHIDGTLEYWHATSQQLLFSKKYNQFLHCCEISPDGQYYTFGGDSGRLFMGSLTKGNPLQLDVGHLGSHDNRIFCLKWNPYDPNMFFSGGWDKAVFIWDIRIKTSVSKVFGSYIGGKAIDINNRQQLLLGSNTPQRTLRIYDMKTEKVRTIDWNPVDEKQLHKTTGVLSCFYSENQILAASATRDIRHFNSNYKCISRYSDQDYNNKIFSFSKAQTKKICAIGWNNGSLQLLNY